MKEHPYRVPPPIIVPVPYNHGWEQKLSRFVWRLHVWQKGKFRDRASRCAYCGKVFYRTNKKFLVYYDYLLRSAYHVARLEHLKNCEKYKEYQKVKGFNNPQTDLNFTMKYTETYETITDIEKKVQLSIGDSIIKNRSNMDASMKQLDRDMEALDRDMEALTLDRGMKALDKDMEILDRDMEILDRDMEILDKEIKSIDLMFDFEHDNVFNSRKRKKR